MDAKLIFDSVDQINKEKKDEKLYEMLDLIESSRDADEIEVNREEYGNEWVHLNKPVAKEAEQKTDKNQSADVLDKKLEKAIKEKTIKAIKAQKAKEAKEAKEAYKLEKNASAQKAKEAKLKEKEIHANQLKELKELAKVYDEKSLSRREKELVKAKRFFAKMERKKEQLDKEKDWDKRLALQKEIIQLKAQGLISWTKAYGKDKTTTNDEIANIAISANHEEVQAYSNYINNKEKKGDTGLAGWDGAQEQKRLELEDRAKRNINKIKLERKRKRDLDIFDDAVKERNAELKNLDAGNVIADVKRNGQTATRCREQLKLYNLDENGEAFDKLTESSFTKVIDKSVEGALAVRKRLSDFTKEIERNVNRIEQGKPIVLATRQALNVQYTMLVKLCHEYLTSNKTSEESEDDTVKKSYDYVKKLNEKLTTKSGNMGIETTGIDDEFARRFTELSEEFSVHRRHHWSSLLDRTNEEIQCDLHKLKEEGLQKTQELLKLKSVKLLNDKEMESVLGTEKTVSIEALRTKMGEIKLTDNKVPVALDNLEYNVPEGDIWEEDNSLLAVDAVLRSNGIFLEGGARTLLKAINENVSNITEVLNHFDQLLHKHNALKECKPLLEKLFPNQYEVEHKEYMIPPVLDDKEKEFENFKRGLIADIQLGLQLGSAVMFYDSKSRHYVTITAIEFKNGTNYVTLLDGKNKEAKGTPQEMPFSDYLEDISVGQKFTIEYLKPEEKSASIEENKKKEKEKGQEKEQEKDKEKEKEENKEKEEKKNIIENKPIVENEPVLQFDKLYDSVSKFDDIDTSLSTEYNKLQFSMEGVKYKPNELISGNLYDKILEKLWIFKSDISSMKQAVTAQITDEKQNYGPLPILFNELDQRKREILDMVKQHEAMLATLKDRPMLRKNLSLVTVALNSLQTELNIVDFSSLKQDFEDYNTFFSKEKCEEVTAVKREIMNTANVEVVEQNLGSRDIQYKDMLKNEMEYGFIVNAHKQKNNVTFKDLLVHRKINVGKEKTRRNKLKSNEQMRNNCWACSTDVLLRSRGFRLADGYKDVMRYLPENIKTMKQAAKYYAFVANKIFSLTDHAEFIEKVTGKDYSLKEKQFYQDMMNKADFEKGILDEIATAIKDGSAVSLRDPDRNHYITVIDITKNKSQITFVDGNDKHGIPQTKSVKGYFDNMYQANHQPVALYWLQKKVDETDGKKA